MKDSRSDDWTALPDRVLFDKHLSPEQLEEIPLEKRIKVLQDYSEPVKFGRSYWHILALSEDSALLLSQDILMEHVEYKDIDARLETFRNENFTDREKQCMADEPFYLDDSEIEAYLDLSQRKIGRHWWVKNAPPLEKRQNAEENTFVCINDNGRRDVFYWNIPLSIRPAVRITIPHDRQDTRWNSVWENATIHEFNMRGAWKARLSDTKETVELHPHNVADEPDDKPDEIYVMLPHIDVTDM